MARFAPVVLLVSSLVGCWAPPDPPERMPTGEKEIVVAHSSSTGDAGIFPSDDDGGGPRPVTWLANIGDSISQGFDADDSEPIDLTALSDDPTSVFRDQPSLSWIKGDDPSVASVASHLRVLHPGLRVTSASQTGAEVVGRDDGIPNFEDQAHVIVDDDAQPDLVHVLLGGNDVCSREPSSSADATRNMYSVDRWRQGVIAGLNVLAKRLPPKSTVRVSSMPRVDLLYDATGDAAVPVTAAFDSDYGPVTVSSSRTCKELWSLATWSRPHGICAIVTTERSDARRTQIGKRIDDYNDALAEEVRRFGADPKLNPNGIRFQSDWAGSLAKGAAKNTSVGTFVFEASHVSKRDCFHPSVAGQRAIASLVLDRAQWR